MKKLTILSLAATLLASPLWAHSKMSESNPADGDVIEEMPEVIVFDFANKIRLTKVEVTYDDETVELDLSEAKWFSEHFELPVEAQGEGDYHLEWRGLGADGHVMKGELNFELSGS